MKERSWSEDSLKKQNTSKKAGIQSQNLASLLGEKIGFSPNLEDPEFWFRESRLALPLSVHKNSHSILEGHLKLEGPVIAMSSGPSPRVDWPVDRLHLEQDQLNFPVGWSTRFEVDLEHRGRAGWKAASEMSSKESLPD